MYVLLDHSDGRYSTRPVDDEETKRLEAQGVDVAHVEDDVWAEYLQHCGRDGIWQALWRSISNEQYVRRLQKELLPLEDANREIARLRIELERAERMAKHFEGEWMRERGIGEHSYHTAEARSYNGYTCVFPQPGCNVDLLPSEWQARAREILAKYREHLAAQGIVHQGCCCGHEHRKLDEPTTLWLRNHGFLVEHDSEPDDPQEVSP